MTDFRISGRVQKVGAREYLAIVTAIPENGDRDEIRTLSQLLASCGEAREMARRFLGNMRDTVSRIEGRVTAVDTDGI